MTDDTFTEQERQQILLVKARLQDELNDFNLTLGKLGRNMVHTYFVSGGCIGSLLRGEEINDIDVYFFNVLGAQPVIDLYTKDSSYQNEVAVYEEKYREVTGKTGMVITENAVTLRNKIQLITKHYGEPEEVRKSFDYVHCMPYYDSRSKTLYISREQYDANMNRHLVVNNTDALTVYREQKFKNKGWT